MNEKRSLWMPQFVPCFENKKNLSKSVNMKSSKRRRFLSFSCKKNSNSDENQRNKDIKTALQGQEKLIRELRIVKRNTVIDAEWKSICNEAEVMKVSGSSLKYFGHKRQGRTFLYPEEVLYLIEMNKMHLFYNNVRLSLQRSYNILLADINGVTLSEFEIYKYFLVCGYKLMRREQIYQQPCLLNFDKVVLTSTEYNDMNRSTAQEYDVFGPQTSICKSSQLKPDFYLVILEPQEKLWTTLQRINSTALPFVFARNDMNMNSVFSIQNVNILRLDELR